MAEPTMPQSIIDWMNDRQWGWHHLEWHTVRQWDLIGASGQQWATNQGWSRANRQEGDVGNGLEFLVMHRAMIELLKRDFPAQVSLFQGWSQVPTDPNDVNDPVPANGQPPAFRTTMLTAVNSLGSSAFLASIPNDDAFGLYLETSRRPGGFAADMHSHHGMQTASLARRRSTIHVSRSDVPLSLKKPFQETLQKRFAALTQDEELPSTKEELQEMVQVAIELEWFTLPPYLTALWSIKDRDAHRTVAGISLTVAMEEMLHMSLCCNLLVALGGKPQLMDPNTFPSYPDFPPGIQLSEPVSLQKLSLDAIRLFMEIEKPPHPPITIRSAAIDLRKKPATIGEFYSRLLAGIRKVNPKLESTGQLSIPDYMPELIVIDRDDSQIRIAFLDDGSWSYLGRTILTIPKSGQQYMKGIDDSGEDHNGEIQVRFEKSKSYSLRVRVLYKEPDANAAIIVW